MKIISKRLFAVLAITCVSSLAIGQEPRSYSEGPVTNVTYIKILPGQFDAYMAYLGTTYKAMMEEQKKAGIILDYRVYESQARSQDDADIILTTTYKNMAALDGLDDRTEAITAKIVGNRAKSTAASIDRGKMRELVGSQLIRELVLK